MSRAAAIAMADAEVVATRIRADWRYDDKGWYSPDGIHESEWREAQCPFPEEPDYAEFIDVYFTYEERDNAHPV